MRLNKGLAKSLHEHPLFSGATPVGLMSGDNPRYPGREGGHAGLINDLKSLGLKYEETQGKYGAPERSVIIHGPSRKEMYDLGKRHGQEAVIHSEGGQHTFMYTHGPNDGMSHPGLPTYDHWPEGSEEPDDYYTKMPGNGYVRLHFNFDQKDGQAPTAPPVGMQAQLDHHVSKREIGHRLYLALKKAYTVGAGPVIDMPAAQQEPEGTPSFPWLPHPHAYDWHDGNTDHHFKGHCSGGVLIGNGLVKHDGPTMPKHPHTDGAIPNQPKPVNDQAAGKGVATYKQFALPFGHMQSTPSNLTHYDYTGKNDQANKLVADHGFETYYAGGKYGKPDLAKRNYNTKHLMVYDPTPQSGGDFGDEKYTDTWRKTHELAHALTYPDVNKIYGEGRRIGKLGVHRTQQEALRAVHWEWLAAHKQRDLSESMGIKIPDETFHKELNTVMHDAAHRAVTGKFTEPSEEGFVPHSHKVPLETSLGLVREAARNLNLQGDHDLVKKSEGVISVSDTKKQLGVPEVLHALHGTLVKRIDDFAQEALKLRKRETEALLAKPLKKDEGGTGGCNNMSMGEEEMNKDSESDMAMSECSGTAKCKCDKCEGMMKYAKGEWKIGSTKPVADKLAEGSGGDITKGKGMQKAAWMPATHQAAPAKPSPQPKPAAPVKKAGMGMGSAPAAGGMPKPAGAAPAAPKLPGAAPKMAGAAPKLPGMGGAGPKLPGAAGAAPKPAAAMKTPAPGAGSAGAMKAEKPMKKWEPGQALTHTKPAPQLGAPASQPGAFALKPAPQLAGPMAAPAKVQSMAERVAARMPAGGGLAIGQTVQGGAVPPPAAAPQNQSMVARSASKMQPQSMVARVASAMPTQQAATSGLQLPGAHLFGGKKPAATPPPIPAQAQKKAAPVMGKAEKSAKGSKK